MSEKKIIAVVGATGAQGGGLARAILNDPESEFVVRAITRDANSDKAKALAALGAEIVETNINDIDSVKKAFKGAHGAYCVTFFWADLSADNEIAQAKTMAEAARAEGVKHLIWSTLEDTRKWVPLSDNRMPTLLGKYKVPHFDAKGESDRFFTEAGAPTTFLLTAFYWENFIYFGMGPKKGPDGKYAITFPMGKEKLVTIAAEDIGKCAYGIFKRGNEFIGKTVGIAGGVLTIAEMAGAFSKVLGKEVAYNEITPDVYRGFGFPAADELGNMFQIDRDFSKQLAETHSVEFSRSINPELLDFETWVSNNKSSIPLE